MKIGVIIPDRGDRPEFKKLCLQMLRAQTLEPHWIEIVNYPPETDKPDITQRYRRGYEKFPRTYDVFFFIENDDYYAPTYIEEMCEAWNKAGRPDLFGTAYTTYYHLRLRKYFKFNHPTRSSAMNTMIKPGLAINWCDDHEVFTDMFLWTRDTCFNGTKAVWTPPDHLSIGIKHGIGKCGGRQHTTGLQRFTSNGGLGNEENGGRDDENAAWLEERVKDESTIKYYKDFFNKF